MLEHEETKKHIRQQAMGMMIAFSKTKNTAKLFEGLNDDDRAVKDKRRAKNKVGRKSRRINRRHK